MNRTIYLAGGCFWGTQKYLDQIDGVLETEVGFANGCTEHPSYEEVCHNNTGHAETVRVVYDSQKLPLAKLLGFYFRSINPTSVNRQGGDSGSQYRTGIYYTDPAEEPKRRWSASPPSSEAAAKTLRWRSVRWSTSTRRRNTTRSTWRKIQTATATWTPACSNRPMSSPEQSKN